MSQFRIRNTHLPSGWFEKIITDTLTLYDEGKDLKNSPLIEFQRNYKITRGMHLDCWKALDYEKCIQERVEKVIGLYESIKKRGYSESRPICVWFDDDGFIHLYDGHHRLAILKHLGIEVELTASTEWKGAVEDIEGKDFPLVEKFKELLPGHTYSYQQLPDERLKDFQSSRKDMELRLEQVLKWVKGKTVLEIGCSEGYFSHELAKRGYEVTAVDIDKRLVAIARYLGTIQGAKIDFRTADWRDILRSGCYFDNILYFSVFHNTINAEGEANAFNDLGLLKGKTNRILFEYPNVDRQPTWKPIFMDEDFHKRFQREVRMEVKDTWKGVRHMMLVTNDELKRGLEVSKVRVNDCSLLIPKSKHWNRAIKETGQWEKKTTAFVKKNLKPDQVFLDVGAYIGYFSVLASKLGAKVHAFEPSTPSFDILEKNLVRNECKGVTTYKKALYNKSGKMKLFDGETPGEKSLIKGGGSFEMVETVKADDVLKEIPDMIKIDVEFATLQVLKGMDKILSADKKMFLIVEDWSYDCTEFIKKKGFRLITTENISGIRIYAKKSRLKYKHEPIRFHLLGPFNTPTNLKDEGLGNAFSSKAVRMARILKTLGHEVIFYGVEGSEVDCDESVVVSSREVLERCYGKREKNTVYGCKYDDLAHQVFTENAIKEVNKRKHPGDFLLCCFGSFQKPIAEAVQINNTLEIGIGYGGSFARFRIFESRFQMNLTYGAEEKGDGNFYDAVIPGYFDTKDFEYSAEKDDYFLYLGRIIKRKGVLIAQQVCEKIGARLVLAGFGYDKKDNSTDAKVFQDIIKMPNVEYVGFAGLEERKKLMSHAKGLFMPTTYLEPFGYVAVEAMMSGTPIITTNFGAFPETNVHGVTGYRCNTFEQFVWAAKNIDKIKPENCRKWAVENYSMEKATKMYQEYFDQILNLYGKGWYQENPERKDLDYLKLGT